MIRLKLAAATLGLALLAPAPAQAQDVIDMLFQRADNAYDIHSFRPFGWQQTGDLKPLGEISYTVTFRGASQYSLVGVCDAGCDDIDIFVTDENGALVVKDDEGGDYAVVYIDKPGSYRVRVVMKHCTADVCAFGIKAYRPNGYSPAN